MISPHKNKAINEIYEQASRLVDVAVDKTINEFIDDLNAWLKIENDSLTITVAAFHPDKPDEDVLTKKFNLSEIVMGILDDYPEEDDRKICSDVLEMYAGKLDELAALFRKKSGLSP